MKTASFSLAIILALASPAAAADRTASAPADGVTPATPALQKAVDDLSASGGGTLVVPPGAYVTASLRLKDNVTLRLSKGATLLGSTNAADYARSLFAVVGAVDAKRVAIEGEGVVDGRGWAAPVRDGAPNRWKDALFFRCRDVRVEGVTMKAPASWTFYLKECEDCVVRGVTIYSHANFNNDGIDIDAKNVLIENCTIDSDDDAICPKSDNSDYICENVEVRNCTLASNCNFIKFGTASRGGFRNCFVHHCVLRPCAESHLRYWHGRSSWDKRAKGLPGVTDPITGISGVALEMVDGGILENIHVSDIKLTGGVQTPIFVRLGRRRTKPDVTSVLRNCVIENVSGTSASFIASSVTGVPGLRPNGIVLRNIDLVLKAGGTVGNVRAPVKENERGYPENRMFGTMLPAYAFYLRHADGIRFENVRTRFAGGREERPAVMMDDCTGITFDSACSFAKPDGDLPAIDTRTN